MLTKDKILNFIDNEKIVDIYFYEKPVNWIEFGIIGTATSERHIDAFLYKISKEYKGVYSLSIDSDKKHGWSIINLENFVIHIFTEEKREYYTLDEIWSKNAL